MTAWTSVSDEIGGWDPWIAETKFSSLSGAANLTTKLNLMLFFLVMEFLLLIDDDDDNKLAVMDSITFPAWTAVASGGLIMNLKGRKGFTLD